MLEKPSPAGVVAAKGKLQMATEEDLKKSGEPEEGEEESEEQGASAEKSDSLAPRSPDAAAKSESSEDKSEDAEADSGAPIQLGYQRFVYAAYMAGALLAAFLFAKIGHAAWYRLGQWKTELGEPKDELLFPVAGLLGVIVAVYYWKKPDARKYADEVAEELSKVTWPTRQEVTNSTTVVVLTTLFATVFFALMDRFWGFITDKIYTF